MKNRVIILVTGMFMAYCCFIPEVAAISYDLIYVDDLDCTLPAGGGIVTGYGCA